MMYLSGYGGGYGMSILNGLFSFVISVLFIVLIVIGVRYLLRELHGGRCCLGLGRGTGALATLRERYARGEIDTKEFEERRKILMEQ